jgi:hypothetical protein
VNLPPHRIMTFISITLAQLLSLCATPGVPCFVALAKYLDENTQL